MPGQAIQALPADVPPEQQIASLKTLLATLERTRSSLPTLLNSVASSSSASPANRAQIYRAASAECNTTVRTLGEQLDALEGVLHAAEESAQRDPHGIVVRHPTTAQPEVKPQADARPWAAVGEILDGGAAQRDAKGKGREIYSPQFDPPSTAGQLTDLAQKWQVRHPRARVQVVDGGAEWPRQLRVVLKGVLQATIALRWAERADGSGRTCEADTLTCHALRESRPAYLPSQFSLFNSLTNDAMKIIDRCRTRKAAGEATASVEEILAFLSDPPLPF